MRYLIFLLAALNLTAAEFDLRWDHSPTSGVTNYIIYASTNTLVYTNRTNALVRINAGTNTTAHVSNLQLAQWNFALTAVRSNIESAFSNTIQVEVPPPPSNFRVVFLQFSGTLTNFHDVGFFRLRLE